MADTARHFGQLHPRLPPSFAPMRFVTVLIVLTLVAAVYVANSAPDSGSRSGSGGDSTSVADGGGADGAADGSAAAAAGQTDADVDEIPTSFPEGLDRRSGFTPVEVSDPLDGAPLVGDPLTTEGSTEAADDEALDLSKLLGDESTSIESGRTETGRIETSGSDESTTNAASTPAGTDRDGAISIDRPIDVDTPSPDGPGLDNSRTDRTASDVIGVGTPAQGGGGQADRSSDAADDRANDGANDGAEINLPGSVADSESSRTDTVEPSSADADGQDATLEAGMVPASISGLVVGPKGGGIKNVQIAALDAKTRAKLGTAKTAKNGRFEFTGLDNGAVMLEIVEASVPLGYAKPVASDVCRQGGEPAGFGSTCVDIVRGRAPGSVDIILPYSSGIEGRVLGKSGRAVENALVRAVCRVKGFESVRVVASSASDGAFFLPLVPGPYELQILLPGDDDPESIKARTRRMDVEAEAGSALMLEAIDFSKPAPDRAKAPRGKVEVDSDVPDVPPAVETQASKPAIEVPERAPERVAVQDSPEPIPALPVVARRGRQPTPFTGDTAQPMPDVSKAATRVELPPVREELTEARAPRTSTPESETPGVGQETPTSPIGSPIILGANDAPIGPTMSDDADAAGAQTVSLEGRVISTWGEAVDGVDVVCLDERGIRVASSKTDDAGRYVLAGAPLGRVQVLVAPDTVLGKRDPQGMILRERPKPVLARSTDGQRSVTINDVVIDVAPVFRVAGKIEISDATLRAFRDDLIANDPDLVDLGMHRFRRTYLRGLRLVRKDALGKGRDKPIEIDALGQFEWQCNLPAEDAMLVLSPRMARPGVGYGEPIGVVVTPAGARTAPLTIHYPPKPKEDPAAKPVAKEDPATESPAEGDPATDDAARNSSGDMAEVATATDNL